MIKRYLMIVEGQVQGVGFRAFCMRIALQNGLTGSASNLDNGNVEILIQGERSAINTFIDRILAGDRFIHITDYHIKEVPVDPGLKDFTYGHGNYF